jgi:hypothetical protein
MQKKSGALNVDKKSDKIMIGYKRTFKQTSIKRLFEINKKDKGLTTKRLLNDRRRYKKQIAKAEKMGKN